MKKYILGCIAILILGALVVGFVFKDRIERARMITSMFSGAEQYQRFNRVPEFFPHTEMPAAVTPFQFGEGAVMTLPTTFIYKGKDIPTESFMADTDTVALLVLKDGDVVFERYMLTGGRHEAWLSMSVAKSFMSALIGIAIDEGHIKNVEEPITNYVPSLIGSAYEGVRIKDILQMSSGARWNEDYSDPESDIARFGRIFALGGSMNEFSASLENELEPGTFSRYNSTDTQVLGMLLAHSTGYSVTDYMTEKLWQPMGAEAPAYWLIDSEGMEMVWGGLNAVARDYAKIGEMYRLGGRLNGQQIVPEDWVSASISPDAPHLQPGMDNPASDFELGYGYQWWILDGSEGEFSGLGVYNQFVYVNPAYGVVIVKLSANSDYGLTNDQSSYREIETFELFRAIVAAITVTDGKQ